MYVAKNQKSKKKYELILKKDFLYNSYWMEKFINKFIKSGKKQLVEKTVFSAFKKIKKQTNLNTFYFLLTVLIKFRPIFGFISKRLGKQFKKAPLPLFPRRQTILSLTWLTTSIEFNPSSSFESRIRHEFLDLHARKKTALWKRYAYYTAELYACRLNQRFRWK